LLLRVIVRTVAAAQVPPATVAPVLMSPPVSAPASRVTVASNSPTRADPTTAVDFATRADPTTVVDLATRADPATSADPAAQRAALLASHAHLLRRAWRAGNDPAGLTVSGDIVWDPATQTGYMRFVGLRRNEPNAEQYQLWIFDARRDERYPIDGGVFNISGARGGDVIPIRAKLSVGVPLMFAVTIEHPGGVVVSDRTRIAALADTI
jgi:hypothetical protein